MKIRPTINYLNTFLCKHCKNRKIIQEIAFCRKIAVKMDENGDCTEFEQKKIEFTQIKIEEIIDKAKK